MTIQQANKQLLFQLYHIYEEREAANIADLVMEKVTEWKRIDRILNKEVVLSADKEKLLAGYITELSGQKPVQYVLNEAWFFGMKLYVDEHVLIPRPETEELLNWVLEDVSCSLSWMPDPESGTTSLKGKGIKILDVGTGSGCIALGLKKRLPLAEVFACDVSEQALAVAQKNALIHGATVNFIQCDFLNNEAINDLPNFDIIVSNPPYIPINDKSSMHPNVLLFEPHAALFVDDKDPLVFYNAIADFAKTHLTGMRIIFVEIHERMGELVWDLFIKKGFETVELRKDLQGRDRILKVR